MSKNFVDPIRIAKKGLFLILFPINPLFLTLIPKGPDLHHKNLVCCWDYTGLFLVFATVDHIVCRNVNYIVIYLWKLLNVNFQRDMRLIELIL